MGYTAREWPLMCCVCFSGLTPDDCHIDRQGNKWDVCKGQCAEEAWIDDAPQS